MIKTRYYPATEWNAVNGIDTFDGVLFVTKGSPADVDTLSFDSIVDSLDSSLSEVGELYFQNGPIKEVGVNGVQTEDVLPVLIRKLTELNAKFPNRETSLAITKLQEALFWLNHRTALREQRGVEGTGNA